MFKTWHESAAARLLGLRVRIPPGYIDVCEFCVCGQVEVLLTGPITRPEESY